VKTRWFHGLWGLLTGAYTLFGVLPVGATFRFTTGRAPKARYTKTSRTEFSAAAGFIFATSGFTPVIKLEGK
jgi:hypothetical protein